MSYAKLCFITLILVVLLPLGAQAERGIDSLQVVYHMEVVELSQTQLARLDFSSLQLDSETSLWEFIHEPDVITSLKGLPIDIGSGLASERQQTLRIANPRLVAAIGKSSTIKMVEESIADGQVSGIELTLTPVRVDHQNDQVLTEIALKTSGQKTELDTEVWLKTNQSEPIAIVHQNLDSVSRQLLGKEEMEGQRYFALYLRAETLDEPPSTSTFDIGSLAGLPELLWPRDKEIECENTVSVAVPLNPTDWPEVDVSIWLSKYLNLELVMQNSLYTTYNLNLSSRVFGEDLMTGIRLAHFPGADMLIGFGFSDKVDSPPLVLSAGYYPVVFNVSEKELSKAIWWVQADLIYKMLQGGVGLVAEGEYRSVEASVGVEVFENTSVVLQYKKDIQADNDRLLLGLQYKFGR